MNVMAELIRQARQEAFEEAAKIADRRNKACLKSAAKYAKQKPNDDYWAPSERCAAMEASHIADLIRAAASRAAAPGREDEHG